MGELLNAVGKVAWRRMTLGSEESARLARIRRESEVRERARAEARAPELEARAEEARRREQQRQIELQHKAAADWEKQEYGRAQTKFSGGNDSSKPLVVEHFKLKTPVAFLPPAGSRERVVPAHEVMLLKNPALANNDSFSKQTELAGELYTDMMKRYGAFIGRLRTNWAKLCEAAGVTMSSTRDDPWRGQFSFGTRRVTTVNVPTIIGVKVAGDGLRLRVAHRPGDSAAKNWGTKLDQLKNLFRAAGVDATNLSVVDDARGNIVLRFDDAPSSFPLAIAPEPPKAVVRDRADAINRYQDAAWTLGPDARGNVLRYPVKKYPHVLVASSTGGGKSAWARTTIEQFRVTGWTCFIGSGKVSDFATMRDLPGVAMVTGGDDVAQVAVMVRRVRVEMERRNTQAAEAKQRGDTAAFAFPPILLLLDEWGAVDVAFRTAYKKSDAFLRDVDLILRVGREARVHVVLLSQTIRKTGDGAVPGAWQENLGLTISLGSPSEITLESDAFTAETKGRAAMIGARLKGKPGRGLTVERESGKVVEFQSFYGWSPGTTSLDPNADSDVRPPTEEVRALWERWEPISASVPWIMPRVGIKATSPAWRTGDLSEVANTPTVALTDEHGAVKPGMEQYDPASDEWLGKQPASTATGLHEDLDFDKPETNAPTANAATMSDAELQEAVRQEAIRRGLLDPDPEPESPGETSQRSKPTPKPETKSATKPKIQGEV